WAAVTVPVPDAGDVHGAQSGTITAPSKPLFPACMCAAVDGPVTCDNARLHVTVVPLTVAVNLPAAPDFVPLGTGFSWPTLSTAVNVIFVALFVCVAPVATPETTSAAAPSAMIGANFFNASSLFAAGLLLRKLRRW